MASLPPETETLLDRLRQHIVDVLPTGKTEVITQEDINHPLLLLALPSELAAFAIANGDPRKCYEESYPLFKKLYASKQKEWDSLNVSFVLCLAQRNDEFDNFYSALETDAYFCRKFVVSLEGSLRTALATLPFIPLERTGSFQRPPSAQTLLQQRGVPALLSRFIVQPQQRSADGIIEDCLGGRFGKPAFAATSTPLSERDTEERRGVRLKSASIESFRAYCQRQEFDLDADVVMLYAPNGFGKTSFFDAIDFAATGEIGRLPHLKKGFKKAAANLNAGPEASSVTLAFRQDDDLCHLTRTVVKRKEPRFEQRPITTKEALAALTFAGHPAGGEHVRNFISLFRATHLFSQAAQELAQDFPERCELPGDVVSRMLAFEDYSTANKKLSDVLDSLKKRLQAGVADEHQRTAEIAAKRAQFQRLETQNTAAESGEALSALIEETRARVRLAGIDVGTENVEAATLRQWRALLEARVEKTRSRRQQLTALVPVAAEIQTLRPQMMASDSECSVKSAELEDAERRRLEVERLLEESNRISEHEVSEEATLTGRAEKLAWLRGVKPRYDQALAERTSLANELYTELTALAERQATVDNLASELSEIEAKVSDEESQLDLQYQRLARIEDMQSDYVLLRDNSARIVSLEQEGIASRQRMAALRSDLDAAQALLVPAQQEVSRILAERDELERNQSQQQNLLAALEALIVGPECPLCGVNHGSREELQNRIQAQRQSSAVVTEAYRNLGSASEIARSLENRIDEIREELEDTEESLGIAASELQRLRSEDNWYQEQARSLELRTTDPLFADQLKEQREQAERYCTELSDAIAVDRRAKETLKAQMDAAHQALEQQRNEIAAKRQLLTLADNNVRQMRQEAESRQLSADTTIDELHQLQSTTEQELARISGQLQDSRRQLEVRQTEVETARQRVERLRAELLTLEVAVASVRHKLSEHDTQLAGLGVPTDADSEKLTELVNDALREESLLTDTRQAVLSLEIALDAASTSAAMSELAEDIRVAEHQLSLSNETRAGEQPWLQFFDQVRATLDSEQAAAVRLYTDQCGLLTSIIQQRLRSVYGFGNIILKPMGKSIAVRVRRGDEELRPTEFFSESQQQSLLLSIFLTVCTTQTWSAFAPVMLDDPVTHFDDLNTYSFLDLLVGLLDSDFGNRQFIVSTCEERLFQLARQKLQHLGDRARFYSLKSTGREGPVVERH